MKLPCLLFVFFVLGVFLYAVPSHAKNGWPTCPENGRNPEIYMEVSQGNLKYHDGYSTQQLGRMSGKVGRRLGPVWTVSGLTNTESYYELRPVLSVYSLGKGRFCAALKSVTLYLGYNNIDVYLTNKYRPGSCEYEQVLAHENTHVQIFRDTLYNHAQGIERTLRRQAPRIGIAYNRSAKAAQNKLYNMLKVKIIPLIKRMNQESKRKNGRIDTKANYKREDNLCANW